MAKSSNELAEKYGESFVRLDVTNQECNALWFLIHLQYHVLVKEKGSRGCP